MCVCVCEGITWPLTLPWLYDVWKHGWEFGLHTQRKRVKAKALIQSSFFMFLSDQTFYHLKAFQPWALKSSLLNGIGFDFIWLDHIWENKVFRQNESTSLNATHCGKNAGRCTLWLLLLSHEYNELHIYSLEFTKFLNSLWPIKSSVGVSLHSNQPPNHFQDIFNLVTHKNRHPHKIS